MNKLLVAAVCLFFLATGCKKQDTASPLKTGDYYQGGYIFYLDSTGQHGMVVAPVETERAFPWGCTGTFIGFGGNISGGALGWGMYCTNAIVLKCPETYTAARYCYDLQSGGHDDWFLPNLGEWQLAYKAIGQVSAVNFKENTAYWISYEADANRAAYCISNSPGAGIFQSKSTLSLVRPVRCF